ncbi:MAG: glycosyltransferase family 39 protein [Cyanobacteria bacterium]|nr:glycosyltransferase family 39 protein [Cyanobacteriota bacterium]
MRRAALALFVVAAIVYLSRLGGMPMYLASDEAIIANDAHAIATTARTLDGVFLPLFVYIPLSASWFMPYIYYWTAIWLQLLPFAEWSIRVPTAIIGLAGLLLAYRVARRLLGDRAQALIATAMLGCAPTYFILSRYALDYIYPIPFILGWLYCLLTGLERGRSPRWMFGAGLCLAAGFYSYIASMALMPVYFALTIAVLIALRRPRRDFAMMAAGFAIPMLFFAIWLLQHPDVVHTTAQRYGFAPGGGDSRPMDLVAIADRYWRFFHPDVLFLTGDTYLPFSTRTAGVFPFAGALLIALGVFAALGPARSPITLLLVAGFVSSPLPASLLDDPGAIRRAMGMLPFGALLAGLGAGQLARVSRVPYLKPLGYLAGLAAAVAGLGYLAWIFAGQSRISPTGLKVAAASIVLIAMAALADRLRHGRVLLIGVAAAIAMQFVVFQIEYHGEYRLRSAVWLNGNLRGAMLRLIEEHDKRPGSKIYFATFRNGLNYWDLKNRYLPLYWQFYVVKEQRPDLAADTVFMERNADIRTIPPGSIVLDNIEDPNLKLLYQTGATRIADIPEADREAFMTIVIR